MAPETITENERKPAPQRSDPAAARFAFVLTTAELAECTCPEFCERDHETD